MTARTCPDWPSLMELAPDLQFKHYTVAEAQLPADALAHISHVKLGEVEICCDLDHHVFHPAHTDAEVCEAREALHWNGERACPPPGQGTVSAACEAVGWSRSAC